MSKTNDARRSDRQGAGRLAFEAAKEVLYARHPDICPICGKKLEYGPDGKGLYKSPHPLSLSVDHIVPLDAGGPMADPVAMNSIDNLQICHRVCNRQKSNKILKEVNHKKEKISNRILEQHNDWINYRAQ